MSLILKVHTVKFGKLIHFLACQLIVGLPFKPCIMIHFENFVLYLFCLFLYTLLIDACSELNSVPQKFMSTWNL